MCVCTPYYNPQHFLVYTQCRSTQGNDNFIRVTEAPRTITTAIAPPFPAESEHNAFSTRGVPKSVPVAVLLWPRPVIIIFFYYDLSVCAPGTYIAMVMEGKLNVEKGGGSGGI